MRIVCNARFLLPNRLEGLGRFSQEILQRLAQRRPQDEWHLVFDRPFAPHFLSQSNMVGHHLPPPARHPFLWYTWFEWSLPWLLRKTQADVFLSLDGYCSLRSRVPTLMVTHDIAHVHYPTQIPALVRAYYEYYVPRYLNRAEQVVTVSEFVKQDIVAHYGLNPTKITVACNGVRPAFQPLPEADRLAIRQQYSSGKPYFFYLGAVHPRKNVDRLIRAYDRFRQQTDSHHQLLLGGRLAWQTEAVREAHAAAIHQSDIHFLGYLPDALVPRLLGAATALVYVSLSEGFGVPVLEAMQSDVPVITSTTSSLPEVAGDAALLVDPTSESAIAEALLQISQSSDLKTKLIERGRQQRTQFSWERATDAVEEALDQL